MAWGLEYMTGEERPKELRWFSLAKRRQRHELIAAYKSLRGNCKYDEAKLLLLVPGGATRDSVLNLQLEMLRLNLRRNLLVGRLVQNWGNLPREVVEAVFLEVFKTLLDRDMTDLIQSWRWFYVKGVPGFDGLQKPCTSLFLWFHESLEMNWTLETGASLRSSSLGWFKVLVIVSHWSYSWLSLICWRPLPPLISFPRC